LLLHGGSRHRQQPVLVPPLLGQDAVVL